MGDLDPGRIDVDVFSPPREDWLNKTDAYLRG